jgi:hypothetical protein
VAGFRGFLGYRGHPLSGRDPLPAPTVCITVYDAIGGRQHLADVSSSVMHAAQRELELEVELLVVEKLPRHLRSSVKANLAQVSGGLHRAQI